MAGAPCASRMARRWLRPTSSRSTVWLTTGISTPFSRLARSARCTARKPASTGVQRCDGHLARSCGGSGMNATLLLRLMLWDIRVQARERIYLFTAVTTAMFATAVMLLPENAPATVVTAVLLLDPAVIGTGFVGGLVLLERSQNTPPALAVTPASAADYALAKLLSFAALTIA